MKKVLAILGVLVVGWLLQSQTDGGGFEAQTPEPAPSASDWRSGDQVRADAEVVRILADDNEGSRHQRFIVQLASGRTLLIAHNIDLAPRVAGLREGDAVSFYGQYEWNEQGGVVHWTHHDPRGSHPDGWIEHDGRRYE